MIENIVALTGIEPTGRRFSSVQLGLSNCVFGLVQYATKVFRAVRMPDVLPRCCPAAGIRLLAAQSETVIITSFFAEAQSSDNGKYQASVRGRGRDALIS